MLKVVSDGHSKVQKQLKSLWTGSERAALWAGFPHLVSILRYSASCMVSNMRRSSSCMMLMASFSCTCSTRSDTILRAIAGALTLRGTPQWCICCTVCLGCCPTWLLISTHLLLPLLCRPAHQALGVALPQGVAVVPECLVHEGGCQLLALRLPAPGQLMRPGCHLRPALCWALLAADELLLQGLLFCMQLLSQLVLPRSQGAIRLCLEGREALLRLLLLDAAVCFVLPCCRCPELPVLLQRV